MRSIATIAASALLAGFIAAGIAAAAQPASDTKSVERGRYLVKIGGCNDCHTDGYPQSAGAIPENEWLLGSSMGFHGPWGTTYPTNLRLSLNAISEAEWLKRARQPLRPPMPWFNLRDMTDDDLRAIYRYVRSLGPKGQPAPAYVPVGTAPKTPYIDWNPKNLPAPAQSKR